jgi:hypothetical protein
MEDRAVPLYTDLLTEGCGERGRKKVNLPLSKASPDGDITA